MSTRLEYALQDYPENKRDIIKNALLNASNQVSNLIFEKNLEEIKKSIKLCCFSEINNSIVMWSHYANYHKGFCIEYDVSKYPASDFRRRFLFPVIYSNSIFDATDYMRSCRDKNINILHLKIASLIKAKDWEYENEWRLIFSGGVLLDDQSYQMDVPKAIYLGPKISKRNENKILKIAAAKNVRVFKMKLKLNQFELEPQLLNNA